MGALLPRLARLIAILLPLAVSLLSTHAAEKVKNSDCLECHGDKTLTKTNAEQKVLSLFVDQTRFKKSAHGTNSCADCHSDLTAKHPDDNIAAQPVQCAQCHEKQSESYGASVHGLAFKDGTPGAATCVDCHDTHEVLPPTSPDSPLHFSKLAVTCGKCHDDAAKEVAESVHGKAVAAGNRDAATCTDCHSEHKIEQLKNVSSLKISEQVCSKCHASERMNTKYNLPRDRVKTFFESYHGLAAQYGSTVAANCASCHGVHKILPSSDPHSTIHASNLVATCGKCHPGATQNFAEGKIHVDGAAMAKAGDVGAQINWWVRKIYLILIAVVVGVMAAHNLLIFVKKTRAIRRLQHRPLLRMNFSQRLQHFVLLASFIILAVTGFALKFPDSWVARLLGSSEPLRRWSHRVAGVVLLVVGVYHLIYLIATPEGRQLVRDFWPRKKDATDVLDQARYLTGVRTKKPRFGRFGYAEKMEYWAVVWGTIIMGATGLIIWFKIDVTHFLPRWAVEVATTIHYYEAILACLAIVVWHFYHVIFDPDVYPINWACVDGRVSEHWHEEEHPLAQKEKAAKPSDTEELDAPPPPKRRVAPALETVTSNGERDFSI